MRSPSYAYIKAAKISYIILSVALCVLGVLLIAFPDISASVFGTVCGILMILFGIVKLAGYFSRDLYRLAFQYDLIFGILLMALGTVMLVHPESLVTFICIAMGLYILSDGLFKIRIALDSKTFGIRDWWLILAIAAVACVCGFMLMFRPGAGGKLLMILLGITLLCEGILNFITVVTAVKIIKHQKPDVIEVGFEETDR